MKTIRLLPVVVMAVSALLVLKTVGLVTNGAYVLTGPTMALAASGAAAPKEAGGGEGGGDAVLTLPAEPTMADTSPTMTDTTPSIGGAAPAAAAEAASAGGEHGAAPAEPAAAEAAPAEHGASPDAAPAEHGATAGAAASSEVPLAQSVQTACLDTPLVIQPASGGEGAAPKASSATTDCLPSGDAVPMRLDSSGKTVPLVGTDGTSLTEQQLLERLAARRTELETFEQNLTLRASIVDAAEKRIEERAATLAALEAQIASLVDQRQEMESGQFAGIVAMYETMRPKDAANIFNNLDMDVLLRVAKTMNPRKMAPILAVMDAPRAQELTVKMAALADAPATEMTPGDLAALPQIVGQ